MGTSTSFRAPSTTRWDSVRTALRSSELPAARTVSEIWNAAGGEFGLLTSKSVQAYLQAWLKNAPSLHEQSEGMLPSQAIAQLVRSARHAALEQGYETPASLAEVALRKLAIETGAAGESLAKTAPPGVRSAWARLTHLTKQQLAAQYLAGFTEECTRYYATRVVPEIVGQGTVTPVEAKALVDRMAEAAKLAVSKVDPNRLFDRVEKSPSTAWEHAVRQAIETLTVPGRKGG